MRFCEVDSEKPSRILGKAAIRSNLYFRITVHNGEKLEIKKIGNSAAIQARDENLN